MVPSGMSLEDVFMSLTSSDTVESKEQGLDASEQGISNGADDAGSLGNDGDGGAGGDGGGAGGDGGGGGAGGGGGTGGDGKGSGDGALNGEASDIDAFTDGDDEARADESGERGGSQL
jgi:hypothetical protein